MRRPARPICAARGQAARARAAPARSARPGVVRPHAATTGAGGRRQKFAWDLRAATYPVARAAGAVAAPPTRRAGALLARAPAPRRSVAAPGLAPAAPRVAPTAQGVVPARAPRVIARSAGRRDRGAPETAVSPATRRRARRYATSRPPRAATARRPRPPGATLAAAEIASRHRGRTRCI